LFLNSGTLTGGLSGLIAIFGARVNAPRKADLIAKT
jgi:hypothetical protein